MEPMIDVTRHKLRLKARKINLKGRHGSCVQDSALDLSRVPVGPSGVQQMFEPGLNFMKTNSVDLICNQKSAARPLLALALAVVSLGSLTGCLHLDYYVDPKPARLSASDLRLPAKPKPVHLIFDVYNENGPFLEATGKLAPKVLDVVTFSGLFSSIAKVGSENMPRLQIIITEAPLPASGELSNQPVPQGISANLPGTAGGVVYTLTGSYTVAGKPPVKKTYNHAVHVASSNGPRPKGARKMRAISAVEDIVEQMTLSFLRDLQAGGAL